MHQFQSFGYIPFYKQMIALLKNALDMLDEQGRDEVLQFMLSQQNADGGFKDRGGKSDLYYSLFGGLMLRAAEKETEDRRPKTLDLALFPEREAVEGNPQLLFESILKLKQFITRQSNSVVPGFIEKCCLALLQKELKTGRTSRIKTLISLGMSFLKERHSINLSYQSFVLFLTLDGVLPFRRLFKMASRRMLEKIKVDSNSPCSEVAARVFLQKMMNQDGPTEQELLKSFVCESGGFKAFSHLQQADMLSTAVALFALNYVGCDLRLLKPDCLDCIQKNFSDGAFLSGDGDQTADVEYTFYGLLALGVIAH
jgi:prenyltransferase beta subunit